ncbi:MAG: hypothetical protein MK105_16835 [Crocinitomicaceae bacterium]|nr:hypothetical protein [Crocinitomicaceae bacterium]
MKKVITTFAFILCTTLSLFAQPKTSIAVANPNVTGLYATPEIASKLIRLELIKLDKYAVLDQFDMADVYETKERFKNACLGKTCLTDLGKALNVNYIASGSYDLLGNKIVITIKIIDVNTGSVFKTGVKEFDNQEAELQRMTEILIKEMHGVESPKELIERLKFNNELITSSNVGRVKNNGPRIGYAVMTGNLYEFATRPADQGGLDIFPGVSMIGYQLEAQYVGTENFSALIEGIINISGLEQGQFIPTISLMNGFRFGKAGWEFAFGPGFGMKQVSKGFFDTDGAFGNVGNYISETDWTNNISRSFNDPTAHPDFFEDGTFNAPSPSYFNSEYNFSKEYGDTRGVTKFSTSFLFALGRTFRAGALNIPVNIFYSSKKGGGLAGVSVGFNVLKSKKNINDRKAL